MPSWGFKGGWWIFEWETVLLGWIYSTLMAGEWRSLGFEYLLPSVLDAM